MRPRSTLGPRTATLLFVLAALPAPAVLAGCTAPSSSYSGPVGRMVEEAARAQGVPADLMAAIAHVEGGLRLAPIRDVDADEAIPVAGVLELRHGRFDSLARGAELMATSELALQRDLALGTEAGARVLADLAAQRGIDRASLAAWAPIVEEMSGHLRERDRQDYRARVFAILATGGTLRARGGEALVLAPHDDVPFELTFTPPTVQPLDTPEFAGAEWLPTPQDQKWAPGRDGYKVTMIAVHDTEGGWDASVSTLQNDPGKSCHYIIDADGSRVGQFVHEADTAWHVGNSYYNKHMVGIEHVGFAGEDDYKTALYEKSGELVRDIAARHGLGPNGDGTDLDRSVLVGHQEVPNGNAIASDSPPCSDSPGTCIKSDNYGGANNHRDPGINWEWCQYMEIIGEGAHCKCNDAYGHFNCVHDLSVAYRCTDGVLETSHCKDHSCIVEPIGTDDHCGVVDPGTGGGAGAGGTSGGVGGGGGAGGAGAGGQGGEAGSAGGPSKSSAKSSGCAVSGATPGEGGALFAAALLGLSALASRRRRGRR